VAHARFLRRRTPKQVCHAGRLPPAFVIGAWHRPVACELGRRGRELDPRNFEPPERFSAEQ
jgi:hypothetical protein